MILSHANTGDVHQGAGPCRRLGFGYGGIENEMVDWH